MTKFETVSFPSGRKLKKISLIKESPALSFYTAEEHLMETADDFSSPDEIVNPVWLITSSQADQESLNLWKDWTCNAKSDYFAECKEAAIINNRLMAVLKLDNAKLVDFFPAAAGESFISALCDMAIQLDCIGLSYLYWSWFNIVEVNNTWKLLPSPSMVQTSEPNVKQALSHLAKWLMGLNVPFLQTQPARSIIEMIASGSFPDAFSDAVCYENIWRPLDKSGSMIQLNLIQNEKTVQLEWDSTSSKHLVLICTNGETPTPPSQLIWHENIELYGTPLSYVSGINPLIDYDSGTAQWSRPQDLSKYQTLTIAPAVRRNDWYEFGTPVVVGGPEEANLVGAYFDKESKEVVLTPSWSDDPNITKVFIVLRHDRFAENVDDVQAGLPPLIIERKLINHPIRRTLTFSFKLYAVMFNAVTNKNRIFYSAGLAESCRKIITRNR